MTEFERKRFPGMNDKQFDDFCKASDYYVKFCATVELTPTEKEERDAWVERINRELPFVGNMDLLCQAYFRAFERVTGYKTKTMYDGEFPYDQFPLSE